MRTVYVYDKRLKKCVKVDDVEQRLPVREVMGSELRRKEGIVEGIPHSVAINDDRMKTGRYRRRDGRVPS
jgi:hypothetical protein